MMISQEQFDILIMMSLKKKTQDICEAMHTNDMPALMWISKISKINIQKGVDIEFVQK